MTSDASSGDFELRRQLLQMEMLYEVGVALSESLDLTHVAQEILQRALVMVDARSGMLVVIQDEQGLREVVAQVGMQEDVDGILELAETGRACQQRQTIQMRRQGAASCCLCMVPLECRQKVSGLLVVADKESRQGEAGPFDENDESLLRSFALQAGASLHNAQLHHSLEEAFEQLREAQARIAQLEQLRSLGDMAGEVTHSMRHILGLIIGRADAYLSFHRDPDKAMESILATAESGQELTDRIQLAVRLGVGESRTAEDVNELVGGAVEDVKLLCEQRPDLDDEALEWSVELRDLPTTYANAADLKEVFVNLLLNAAEAMPEGGRVQVTSEVSGEDVVVRIADTGEGIDEETRARMFEPFFTTKEQVGTGLGMSIVLRIIEDHGGQVQIESQVGEGSTVILSIPVVEQAPPKPAEEDDVEADLDS